MNGLILNANLCDFRFDLCKSWNIFDPMLLFQGPPAEANISVTNVHI